MIKHIYDYIFSKRVHKIHDINAWNYILPPDLLGHPMRTMRELSSGISTLWSQGSVTMSSRGGSMIFSLNKF